MHGHLQDDDIIPISIFQHRDVYIDVPFSSHLRLQMNRSSRAERWVNGRIVRYIGKTTFCQQALPPTQFLFLSGNEVVKIDTRVEAVRKTILTFNRP